MHDAFLKTLPFLILAVAAPALPGQATTDYVMADFESGQPMSTPLYGYWYIYTDHNSATSVDSVYGNSTVTSFDSTGMPFYDSLGYPDKRTFPAGRGGDTTGHSLRFAYTLGDRKLSCGSGCSYGPYVGFGVAFTTTADTLDLTGAPSVSFWAKSDSNLFMNVSIGTRDTTTGAADYNTRLEIGPEWKKYTIALKASDSLAEPSWAKPKPFDLTQAQRIAFNINKDDNPAGGSNAVEIDDVTIDQWEYDDPSVTGVKAVAAGRYGLRALRQGAGLRILLPAALKDRGGRVQAMDTRGRAVASTRYGRGAAEAFLALPSGAEAERLFLRAFPDR